MTEQIESRAYQDQAVKDMLKAFRGICVAPAGSGKTIIAARLVSDRVTTLSDKGVFNPYVLWVAHTLEQVEQARAAMRKMQIPAFAKFDFCCYASNPDSSTADILIIDEAHWAGANQVRRIVEQAEHAVYVYGFTATPKREDGIDITEIIGPVLHEVKRDVILEAGGVLPAEVRCISVGFKDELVEEVATRASEYFTRGMQWADNKNGNDENWQRCIYRAASNIGIRENSVRDGMIRDLTERHKEDSILILVDDKKHGSRLTDLIPGAVMVHSGTSKRAAKLEAFKAGSIKCLVCTQLADEGMDVPIAGVLIMAAPGKAQGKVIQRTGRILRPHPGKDKGIIYDFLDHGHGMLMVQHWQRLRTYKTLGYRVIAGAK